MYQISIKSNFKKTKLFNFARSARLIYQCNKYTYSSLVGRFKVRALATSTFWSFPFLFFSFFPFDLHSSSKDTLDTFRVKCIWKNIWRLNFYIQIDNNVEMLRHWPNKTNSSPFDKKEGLKTKSSTNTLVIKRAKLQFSSTGFWTKVALTRLF